MAEHQVDIPADRIFAMVKLEAEGDYVNFHATARKEYLLPGGDSPPPEAAEGHVIEQGIFSIEPLVERDYWILTIVGRRDVGRWDPDEAYSPEPEMSVEAFEERFIAPEDVRRSVSVTTETADAERMFSDWLRTLRSKYAEIPG